MLFNSYIFIFIFLPISMVIYNFKFGDVYKKIVFSSLLFYSYWNPSFLSILCLSIVFNYYVSKKIKNKIALTIAIIINIFVLGYYKYFNFIIDNVNSLLLINIDNEKIFLPLAISFFTFQQIAYLVDNYKNKLDYSFWQYAAFVSFFPQLIAGPIVHHNEILPQIEKSHIKSENISKGSYFFSIGLFKKVVIADTFSLYVDNGYANYSTLTTIEAWVTSLSYSLQLYFDFSGYCDMAIGLAIIFGIKLPLNFNSPYKSLNIQDFWRRWHITLGSFLRDYIYIPLGGNKKSKVFISMNLIITFVIGGIWHGAGWTFVLWGLIHGLALVTHRAWSDSGLKIPNLLAILVTFSFINFTWVLFRAENIEVAFTILKTMCNITELNRDFEYTPILLTFTGLVVVFSVKNIHECEFKPSFFKAIISTICFVSALILFTKESSFLYFNF
mgnify:CR=1 FL=1